MIHGLIWRILFWPAPAMPFPAQEDVWFRPVIEGCKQAATGVGCSGSWEGTLYLVIGVAGSVRRATNRLSRRHRGRLTGDAEGKFRKLCMGPDSEF